MVRVTSFINGEVEDAWRAGKLPERLQALCGVSRLREMGVKRFRLSGSGNGCSVDNYWSRGQNDSKRG